MPETFIKVIVENLFKMEDIIDIDIDEIIKDTINNEEYKEKLKKEKTNYINNFNQNLEKNLKDILAKKGNLIRKEIDLKLSKYSNLSLQIEKERNNFELNFKNDLVNLKKEASNYFKNLNIFFKKQKGGEYKINIKFENKKIERILDIKYAKFINIDNIKITNIGNEVYKNLIFARDNDNSSDNIYFFNNYSNPEIQKLTMPGDFEHDDSEEFNISLKINDPKPNQTYKMIIYVREQNNDEDLSEPLEIIIKINPEEELIQQRKKQANHIYEEIKKEFHSYKNLIDKDEIIF